MAIEIRGNGWNLPTKLWKAPKEVRIEEGYRTIQANSIKDANQYMKDNYLREIDSMDGNEIISFKNCHHNKNNEYSYIVLKQIKS